MNSITKLLWITVCASPLIARYYTNIPFPLSTSNVEIAWDLHDVVFKKKVRAIINKSFKHFGNLAQFALSRKKKYKQLRKEWRILRATGATAEVLEQLFHKHGETQLASIINTLALQLKPDKSIAYIICTLACQGYTQRVASNMGPTFLDQLRQKHHVLSHLEGGVTGTYINGKQITHKPNASFYEQYNTHYNPTKTKTIILIDDKIENVYAAQQAGWIGVHFTNVKALVHDLQSLGINLTIPVNHR